MTGFGQEQRQRKIEKVADLAVDQLIAFGSFNHQTVSNNALATGSHSSDEMGNIITRYSSLQLTVQVHVLIENAR